MHGGKVSHQTRPYCIAVGQIYIKLDIMHHNGHACDRHDQRRVVPAKDTTQHANGDGQAHGEPDRISNDGNACKGHDSTGMVKYRLDPTTNIIMVMPAKRHDQSRTVILMLRA